MAMEPEKSGYPPGGVRAERGVGGGRDLLAGHVLARELFCMNE